MQEFRAREMAAREDERTHPAKGRVIAPVVAESSGPLRNVGLWKAESGHGRKLTSRSRMTDGLPRGSMSPVFSRPPDRV